MAKLIKYPKVTDLTGDHIVYLYVSRGGGVDGRDPSDKGGVIKEASLSQLPAPKADAYRVLEKRVVDMNEARKNALKKLDALDKLVLGLS